MATPRVLILRAPGTNCDRETAHAFDQVGGHTESLHINRLLEAPHLLRQFQILCIPGGFSYGDDLAAGQVLGSKLEHHLRDALGEFKSSGKLILGICNGFQVLLRSGLLLEPDATGPRATLAWNESGRFEDRWVHLRVHRSSCVFLRGVERLELPVAHAEGRFVVRDSALLEALFAQGQVPLTYAASDGADNSASVVRYPHNPNGSMGNVAGVCDPTGHVFGLMPHPERHIDATHHPRWTRRRTRPPEGDGLVVFRNAVAYFAS